MKRRALLGTMTAGLVAPMLCGKAFAQSSNGIKLVIPFPAGGGGDVLGRSPLDALSRNLGKDIWVLNRPGAGGNIGTSYLIDEPQKDASFGYVTNGIMCVNRYLYNNMKFDPLTDLEPVGQISKVGLVMVLNTKAIPGVEDYESLVKYSKSHPGEMFFASSGVGTTSHLAGQFFAMQTGLNLTHVPHAGGAAAMVEVLAGRIPFMIDVAANALPHVKKGSLKAIAVTTGERLDSLPNIPTMKEIGLKDYELCAWDGYVVPKGAPKELKDQLSKALVKCRSDQKVIERIKMLGAQPVLSDGAEFAEFIKAEAQKWKTLAESISQAK